MKFRVWTIVGALVSSYCFAPLAPAQSARGLPDFTELYEQQGPAVVSVDVTQKVRRSQLPDISEDDPFYEFFRRFGQVPRGQPRPRDFEQQSVGSGFILSSDGYILTNAHVVDDASEVSIKLSDKREFKARVIGADKRTDVAVLKIEATGLPKVTIGDPERLKVGEWVAAIGKPFGLENTITAGIVSAKGRDLPQENLVSFIQTDVPINSVEKGGPADKAGVESGDVILKVDGKTVSSSNELPRMITPIKPGTKIAMQVWRKGATKDLSVTVAELKEDEAPRQARRTAPPKEKSKPNKMGLVLSDLN